MKEMFDLSKAIRSAVVTATLAIVTSVTALASGVNVTSHTPDEIRSYIASQGNINSNVEYSKAYKEKSDSATYSMGDQGDLTETTRENALKMLQNIRYIAGLSTDVVLDDTLNKQAQAGAYLDYIGGVLSHEPTQPANMADDLYKLGYAGTSSSNIAWGQENLTAAVLDWTADDDIDNIDKVGHRRWLLNPRYRKVGLGAAGVYYAISCFDTSGSGTQTGVAWPAQNMPIEYFNDNYPWSISMGESVSNAAVTLTRVNDGKTWSFSSPSTSYGSKGYYYGINNVGYGQKGCIIFRPDNISYHAGDRFHVQITGSVSADYYVNFFSLTKVTSFSIPKTATIQVGGKTKIYPEIEPKEAANLQALWTSSDQDVCTVDDEGYITATGALGDTATVTAELDGIKKSCKVTIGKSIKGATVSFAENETAELYGFGDCFNYTGKEIRPSAVVSIDGKNLEEGKDYTLTYRNNINYNMDEYNTARIGIYRPTMILSAMGEYGGNIEKVFDIRKIPISSGKISVNIEEIRYTGSAITPAVEVKYTGGTESTEDDWVLVKDVDYTLSMDGSPVNAGESGTVAITGIGNFYGTRTETYTVEPISMDDVSIEGIGGEATYTGSPVTFDLTVTSQGNTLAEGTDYEVSYESNTDAGVGSVKVSGKGNYAGDYTSVFTINPKDLSGFALAAIENQTYIGAEIKPEVQVTDPDRDVELTLGTDYTLTYENNLNAASADAADAPKVIITGNGNYTGSIEKTFTIDPADMDSVTVDPADGERKAVYTGKENTIDVTLSLGDYTLKEGTDYTIDSYSNNIKVSTEDDPAVMTVEGSSNFTGRKDIIFMIIPGDLNDAEIKAEDVVYSGSEQKVDPTITLYGVKLTRDQDYTLSYSDDVTNVGTVTVTATGIGSLEGEIKTSYQISRADINEAQMDRIGNQEYTGREISPILSLTYNEMELEEGEDYSVTYNGDHKNLGVVKFVISGLRNFDGTKESEFEIVRKDISGFEADFADSAEFTYTGYAIEPAVSLTDDFGDELVQGQDFEVVYSNNENASTKDSPAVAEITGIGNYTGTITKNFTIAPAELTSISGMEDRTYNGKGQIQESLKVFAGENGDIEVPMGSYDVGYEANVNAGPARVVVTAIDGSNFQGSVTDTFTIKPADLAAFCTVSAEQLTYSKEEQTAVITVKEAESGRVVSEDDYTISGTTSAKDAADYTFTVTAKENTNYTGSLDGSFHIEPMSIKGFYLDIENQEYSGQELTPDVTLTDQDGYELEADTDFTVTGDSLTDAGSTEVTVEGKGNYKDNLTGIFNVTAADIIDADVDFTDDMDGNRKYSYTGSEIQPAVSLTFNGRELEEGKDYTVEYYNNTKVTSTDLPGTVKIIGDGNFTGERKDFFTVVPADIGDAEVKFAEDPVYDGQEHRLVPEEVVLEGKTLTAGTDYIVASYVSTNPTDNASGRLVNKGTVTVTISGTGNYTGTATGHYSIGYKRIERATVTLTPEEGFTYTGSEFRPSVTVVEDGETLIENRDYSIFYDKNIDAGTASVTIVANEETGNYQGRVTKTFQIAPQPVQAQVEVQDKVYDGTTEAVINVTATGASGENIPIEGVTGTFSDPNAGINKEVIIDSSNVQTNGNYAITYPEIAAADITKRSITLKIGNQDILYGKFDDAAAEVTNAADVLVQGDTLSSFTTVMSGEASVDAQGSISIDPDSVRIDRDGFDTGDNYIIAVEPGTYTIVMTDAQQQAARSVEEAAGPETGRSPEIQSIVEQKTAEIKTTLDEAELSRIVSDATAQIQAQLQEAKDAAIAAIDAAVAGDTNENVMEAAAQAKAAIESAETVDDVQAAQTAGEQAIAKAKTAKQLQEAKDAAIAAIDAAVAGDTSANVTEAAASSKTAIGNAATAADVQAAQQAGLAAIAAAKEANAKPQTPETQAPVQETYPAAGTALTLGDVTFVSQGDGTVIYQKVGKKAKKKLTTANIPAIVTIDGRNYRVIGIANGAFRNCKKLRKVTIGANVQMIGKKAFYGCGKLKKVVIQSQVLASAGKGAFGKTAPNLVIKVPKPCKAAYQKMLKKTGISKKAKIR